MTSHTATMQPTVAPPSTVQEMQQRVVSAFGGASVEETCDVFLRIRDGLAAGTICGTPLTNPTVACMLELLKQLGWVPSVDRFARSMPHFPIEFGLTDLREVCGRLGYTSEEVVVHTDEIEPTRLPGIALEFGPDPLVATYDTEKGVMLTDPVSGKTRPIDRRSDATIILFRAEARKPLAGPGKSWFGALARRFSGTILKLLGLTLVINLMVIAASLTVMAIYDSVLPTKAMDTLFAIVSGVAIAFLFELWLRRIRAQMIGHVAARIEYLIGSSIFAKLIALPLDMVANVPVGTQIARLKQFETIRDLVAGALVAVGMEIPFVFLFTGFLFVMGGPLGFIPVALIVVYAMIAVPLFPIVRRLSAESSEVRSERYRLVLDTLSNLRTIRSLGCEDLWLSRISESAGQVARLKRRSQEANRVLATLSAGAVPLTGGATVLLGAHMVMNQDLTVGALIACMIVIWRVITPVQQAMLLMSRYADLSRQVGQLDRLMAMPEEVADEDGSVRRDFAGAIGFERATFRYRGTIEPSLMGIELQIKPGELVAVGGPSGSGKTTLLRMILNLYQPQSGAVTMDGINIRQVPVHELRSAIGYVPQSPAVFHGTIAQNLRLAAPAIREDEIKKLAAELGILESINDLPNGFDSRLHEFEQTRMARGLMQVLAVMQALLRQPSILLLDEPAKSLDPVLEKAFLGVLERLRGNTTVVMVTHRPSHMNIADRVVVLNRGQLVKNGPPEPSEQKVPA